MGRDIDLFVHPERISSQLICPICTLVLTNPVQTSTDHLFCEEELLEWMTRSNLCPVTKAVLDPSSIRKPSRIILNMLAELQVYCSNKCEGCTWTGAQEALPKHMNECQYRPRNELFEEISARDAKIEELSVKVQDLLQRNEELAEENIVLKSTIEEQQQRLRIYNALIKNERHQEESFESDTFEEEEFEDETKQQTDLDRYKRLQPIKSLMEAKEEYSRMRK